MKYAPFSSLSLSCLPERRAEKKVSPQDRSVVDEVAKVSWTTRQQCPLNRGWASNTTHPSDIQFHYFGVVLCHFRVGKVSSSYWWRNRKLLRKLLPISIDPRSCSIVLALNIKSERKPIPHNWEMSYDSDVSKFLYSVFPMLCRCGVPEVYCMKVCL